jgi:hypothetical protein
MRNNRHIKTFVAFIAGAPYSCFPKIHIRLNQFFLTSRANQFIGYSKTLLCIDVSAFDVFNKRTFSNIEGFAVWARIAN